MHDFLTIPFPSFLYFSSFFLPDLSPSFLLSSLSRLGHIVIHIEPPLDRHWDRFPSVRHDSRIDRAVDDRFVLVRRRDRETHRIEERRVTPLGWERSGNRLVWFGLVGKAEE